MFESYQLHKSIVCIDFKSFYASVECVIRGLDPFTTPLVVADKSKGNGAICLAVSPYLKAQGLSSRIRIFDIPKHLRENMIYAMPQMKTYMETTMKMIELYLSFVAEEDLYVYSIDEVFLDLTSYLSYYKKTDVEIVHDIVSKITELTKLPVSVGIGPNMLMAKLAMDIDSKRVVHGFSKWGYEDIEDHLWPIKPLSRFWGIGSRMEQNLNALGMHSIGDIATSNPSILKKHFGILGEELWYHTHGIDMSILQEKYKLRAKSKSYGLGQVLFHDYDGTEIKTIILEMADEIVRRLRMNKKKCQVVHFGMGYSAKVGGGFSKQVSFDYPTASFKMIYDACLSIFNEKYDGSLIKNIHLSLSKLSDGHISQLSIFDDEASLEHEYNLLSTIDTLKTKFGKNIVNRGSSLTSASTIVRRNGYIGGHKG